MTDLVKLARQRNTLLAVIHADSGEYLAVHGDDTAYEDAITRICGERAMLREYRAVLNELRVRMLAAGRRPEACEEMGMIDDVLRWRWKV